MLKQPVLKKENTYTIQPKPAASTSSRLYYQGNGGFGQKVWEKFAVITADNARAEPVEKLLVDTAVSGLQNYGAHEVHALNKVPIRKIIKAMMKDIENEPELKALFKDYLDKMWQAIGTTDEIDLGAMMARVMGMAALIWHLKQHPELLGALQRPPRSLNRYSTQNIVLSGNGHNGSAPKRHLLPTWLAQVQSAVGGNGSSQGLALNDVLRDLMAQLGLRYRPWSFWALPGVFPNLDQSDQRRIRANGYATLRELVKRHEQPLPPWYAGQAGWVDRDSPGYEITWLVDGMNMNETDNVLSGPDAAAEAVALFISETMLDDGPVPRRLLENIQNKLNKYPPPYRFSSFGIIKVRVDIDKMIALFGYQSGREVIDNRLLQVVPEEPLKKLVAKHTTAIINYSGVLDTRHWFKTTSQGEAIRLSTDFLRDKPRDEIYARAEKRERKLSVWEPDIAKQAETLSHTIFAKIVEYLIDVANNKGLLQAVAVLEQGLIPQLMVAVNTKQDRLDGANKKLTEHGQETAAYRAQPKRKKVSLKPRDRNIQQIQKGWDLEMLKLRDRGTVQTWLKVIKSVQGLNEAFRSAISDLQTRMERLETMERTLVENRANQPEIIVDLLSDEQEQEVYSRFSDDVQQQLASSMKFYWRDNGLVLELSDPLSAETETQGGSLPLLSEESMQRYARFAALFWEFLRQRQELGVEAILEQRDADPQVVGEDWLRHAAPLISVDSYDHKHTPIAINVLGTQRGYSGFFKGVTLPGVTVEATGNPFETVMIATVHGINPLALASSKGMKAAHDQLLAEGEPLYVYPEARLDEPEEKEVKQPNKKKGKKKRKKQKRKK